jgi:hypothetical protein
MTDTAVPCARRQTTKGAVKGKAVTIKEFSTIRLTFPFYSFCRVGLKSAGEKLITAPIAAPVLIRGSGSF